MRTFAVAALLVLFLAAVATPAEARPYPVECRADFYGYTCGFDAVVCEGHQSRSYDGSFGSVGVVCADAVSCGVETRDDVPAHQECSQPASASSGTGCAPTPHGMRCTADLLVCTAYTGAESNGVGYHGFDCGAASCDGVTYQGRVKDRDCTLA